MIPIDTIEQPGFTVTLFLDPEPDNPRDDDGNTVTLDLFNHRRASYGDADCGYDWDEFASLTEIREALESDGHLAITPVYIYDHSGVTLSTSAFYDHWDSWQLGFAWVTGYAAAEAGIEGEEQARAAVEAEVRTYSQYLAGDVCGYVITSDTGEEIGAAWGFYDRDLATVTAIAEAPTLRTVQAG